MSNLTQTLVQDCPASKGCSALKLILEPKDKDLGGFSVRRALPVRQCRSIGPWVFFDHMGPASFPAGEGINVRPHPHIGLATVTYLFAGEMLHRDSLGSLQVIQPGDVNLMVAGRGIVHSERQREEVKAHSHHLHGLQLWLALPEAEELCPPAFYHYPADDIPQTRVNDVPVRVIMGSAYGLESPVKLHSPTLYLEAVLQQGQSLVLPDAQERGLYIVEGSVSLESDELSAHSMAVLDDQSGITITAKTDTLIALVGGDSVGQRYMEWNFVSSDKNRIELAKQDWQNGMFAKVAGDENEFIPLPGV